MVFMNLVYNTFFAKGNKICISMVTSMLKGAENSQTLGVDTLRFAQNLRKG